MGSQSSTQQVTNLVNQTATTVMANISTSAQGSVQQSNTMIISGISDSSVVNIQQSNEANIQVSAVVQSAQSGQLQSQLTAALVQALTTSSNTIGYSTSNINLQTSIKNIVSSNITTNSVNNAFAGITQSNALQISNISGSKIYGVSQTNIGKAIAQLMSSSTEQIIALLGLQAQSTTTATQTTTNPISSVADAIGSALSGNMLVILVIMAAVAFSGFMFKDQVLGLWKEYYPYDLYGLIGLVAGLLVIVSLKSSAN